MHFLLPLLRPSSLSLSIGNPFTPFFLLSHPISPRSASPQWWCALSWLIRHSSTSKARRPRAARVQRCLVSFLRLVLSHSLFPALARRWGIRKAGKVARFGEQGYAVMHFLVVG
ncbi:hypothetical protein B0H13DRAFT_2140153 [Mycena leptocephala]|nr:hypothetical protein B0H13DRAFT_2140153 [Mycena leptocephala]